MLFNTFQFLVFYLVVISAFFALPQRWRCPFLLAASYYFYMCWKPAYVLIIWIITLVDFLVGIRLEECTNAKRRKAWLLLSIMLNFGILCLFKYADFALGTLNKVLHPFSMVSHSPWLGWLLPVGISFHTFQAVAYTVDVYRGTVKAERNLGSYALYVAFFPQMVAGPIERPNALLPQFRQRKRLEYARLRSGLELLLLGLYKKMIVADLIAPIVSRVYDSPRQYGGTWLTLATVGFALQIYADFSGYSDMAVGMARIMGYDLTINFRQPYFAASVAEFWRRWHISLSAWFRDYVYLQLGGNRTHRSRWECNVMLVFLLSGLWHGANWTFVLWGGLHACFVICGRLLKPFRETLAEWSGVSRLLGFRRLLQTLITSALVTYAFIFFRAKSVADGFYIATHCFRLDAIRMQDLLSIGLPAFELVILAGAISSLVLIEFIQTHPSDLFSRWWATRQLRWAVYCIAFYSVVFFGVFDRIEFIYFQF